MQKDFKKYFYSTFIPHKKIHNTKDQPGLYGPLSFKHLTRSDYRHVTVPESRIFYYVHMNDHKNASSQIKRDHR